jgi:tRNA modification GTPase
MAATIFALASGAGVSGVAVIRISGPEAGRAVETLTGRVPPAPRQAALRRFRDGAGREIDQGLVLWFPGPNSFTGEDVAEFQIHGGRAVIQAMLAALGRLPGLQPAGPGAFTRRAFDHGRLDLTQVEGLADLVAAETEAQRIQALRQLDGDLGRLVEDWRQALILCLAHLEAAIDFVEDDLPDDLIEGLRPRIEALAAVISAHLSQARAGERLREGLTVVILGAPNAGKSSLLNRLAGRDAAIVSSIAGTTRDPIEVHLDLDGLPVVLVDTAGLREATDEIEREGIRRAEARAARADLKLLLLDATAPETHEAMSGRFDSDTLLIINKADLAAGAAAGALTVSARTGEGVEALVAAIAEKARERLTPGAAALTRERHALALRDCLEALRRFLEAPEDPELAAEDLRLAARALGRITGRFDVEDVLDVIFSEFCIGK